MGCRVAPNGDGARRSVDAAGCVGNRRLRRGAEFVFAEQAVPVGKRKGTGLQIAGLDFQIPVTSQRFRAGQIVGCCDVGTGGGGEQARGALTF